MPGHGQSDLVVEDPFVTLETLAPYVVTTHVRDSVVFEDARGAAGQWVALGDGNVDLVRFVREFRQLCPHSSMQLEIITGRPPRVLPYLEADFWKAFPKMPAWEFARFVALAKSGHPFMGAMVIEDVPGKRAGGDGRGAERAAADRPGAEFRIRQEEVECGRGLAGVVGPPNRNGPSCTREVILLRLE